MSAYAVNLCPGTLMTVSQGTNIPYCFLSTLSSFVSYAAGSLPLYCAHWSLQSRQNYLGEVNQRQKALFIWYTEHRRGHANSEHTPAQLAISIVWNNRLPVIGFSLILIRELFQIPWMPHEGVGRHLWALGFLKPTEKAPQRWSHIWDPLGMMQAPQCTTYKKYTIATQNYYNISFIILLIIIYFKHEVWRSSLQYMIQE